MSLLEHFAQNKDLYEIAAQIGTVLIAALAFFVATFQTYTTHKHNERMVTPHLGGYWESDHENFIYKYTISNNGLGPAIIKNVTYFLDDKKFESPTHDVVEGLLERLFEPHTREQELGIYGNNEYVPQGETKTIIRIRFKYRDVDMDEIIERIQSRARIEIKYQSIVKKKFRFNSKDD